MDDRDFCQELAQQLRVDSIRASAAAGSGHPTSSMSAAELMAVLFAHHLRYDFDDPKNPRNDHLIFSKGHASPLLYSLYKAAGAISDEQLLSFRKFHSPIEGHPTPVLPWVDVATGSLGFGLPVAVGVALAGRRLDQLPYRVWVLCGDSEMAEGSIWEAFDHASYEKLDNLVAIVDVNRLGQRGPTMHEWDLDLYAARARAFGWHAIEVDGHDVEAVDSAYAEAASVEGRPTAILARTLKGKGVKAVENQEGAHGKPIDHPEEAIAELGGERHLSVKVTPPEPNGKPHVFATGGGQPPRYDTGKPMATRRAYGDALAALGSVRADVVALDGEVGNSTYAELFGKAFPERYFEMFIAEQQMVAAGVGMQVRGWVPFASTFAAFFTRAYDFVRMAAVSRASIRLAGSHAGISIGQDGPSQMGLEDLASFRAVHGSTVLYPCDANQTAALVAAMADTQGVSYMRTTREATPVIYPAGEQFPIGGSRVLRSSDSDVATVVAAGITLHESLKAADRLESEGIRVRLIDLYSLKPVDAATLEEAARATGGRVVTVEDHWPEGGIGDTVLAALAPSGLTLNVTKLAVRLMPGSGTPEELMAEAGIDADAVVAAVKRLV
ncbi:MAG TPA: transketolase [Acidimicrobiales bacterium]|nr:transketolase [Acidimicrobiales bacterium]